MDLLMTLNVIVLSSAEDAGMTPVGWLIIILLIGGIAIAFVADKKYKDKFQVEFDKFVAENKLDGNDDLFVSKTGELIMKISDFSQCGYAAYKLEDIAYIMTFYETSRDSTNRFHNKIVLYNSKKKRLDGVKHMSSKKGAGKAIGEFGVSSKEDTDSFFNMIKKYVPNVERVGKYFKEYEM